MSWMSYMLSQNTRHVCSLLPYSFAYKRKTLLLKDSIEIVFIDYVNTLIV